MAKKVPFHITSGLPFSKIVVATLPSGRDWWLDEIDFEVLSQIREGDEYTSPLLLDLKQFITVTFDGIDEVEISIDMTASDTRTLTKSGYYDIIISDVLATDDRAIRVLSGQVHRDAVVTSDTEIITA